MHPKHAEGFTIIPRIKYTLSRGPEDLLSAFSHLTSYSWKTTYLSRFSPWDQDGSPQAGLSHSTHTAHVAACISSWTAGSRTVPEHPAWTDPLGTALLSGRPGACSPRGLRGHTHSHDCAALAQG